MFFYQASKQGFSAKGPWWDGNFYKLNIILEKLLPLVWEEIKNLSLDSPQTDYWIHDVIKNRVHSGQTGAKWQKAFIHKFGKKFDKLVQVYWENQQKNLPVYQWKV